jgi:hypothetical protein
LTTRRRIVLFPKKALLQNALRQLGYRAFTLPGSLCQTTRTSLLQVHPKKPAADYSFLSPQRI